VGLDGGKWESAAGRRLSGNAWGCSKWDSTAVSGKARLAGGRDNRIGLALQWTTGQCAYVTSVCEAWAVPKAQVTKTMERLLPEAFAVPREYP
jgi:hypothetical protein